MFDDEFFPTPTFVIRKMLEPYLERMAWSRSDTRGKRYISNVLDPSAGAGAILKWLKNERGQYHCPKLMAIELSPQLAAIVQAEKFDLIANDFLSFVPEGRIDLIVMNPPFSNGDEHLLHAWNILKDGDIVCLLNAETIRNPHTKRRQTLAKVIEDHGSVEFLGPAFERAERPTDCEIAMVRLTKVQPESEKLNFDFMPADETSEAGFTNAEVETGTDLAKPDLVGAIVRQYEMSKEAFGDVLRARAKLRFFTRACTKDPWDVAMKALERGRTDEDAFDAYREMIRAGFWEHCFRSLKMEKYLTKGLMEKVQLFVEQQGKMAFTKENIAKMLETMMLNRHAIMQQAVEAIFDEMTKYHEENRVHPEGWKSNESWKVTRKVVMPFYIDATWSSQGIRIASGRHREVADIDKVMCYLSGQALEDVVTIYDAVNKLPRDVNMTHSTFFKIRGFKKGTIHLEFLDEKLWNRFNIEACKGKGWIGQQKERA